MTKPQHDPLILLAWLQGIFYLITGLWPLLHMPSFLAVTGPKVDLWLVKTVGVLIVVIGAVLVVGARRRAVGPELALLAAGSAASLAGVDLVYALSDRIWDVYLLDALAEIALVVLWGILWGIAWLRTRRSSTGAGRA
ncbi:MAG TPA: hypothetical protein VHC97_25120 [Thermoanaerobaculia bacterium]|jgi:hypothetical protein|nr:hypothetical protein [Thermoanaerobaculia bacterium]